MQAGESVRCNVVDAIVRHQKVVQVHQVLERVVAQFADLVVAHIAVINNLINENPFTMSSSKFARYVLRKFNRWKFSNYFQQTHLLL